MLSKHYYRFFFALASCLLVLLLAACDTTPVTNNPTPTSTTPAGTTATTPAGKMPGVTPTTIPTTAPVPPTQTGCPANDTARAAVMAPLAPGNHASIIYSVNQFQAQNHVPTTGALKRYDTVTGNKSVIVTLPGSIDSAQVSADGQWILLVSSSANIPDPQKLQLIRVDGQGLQTLFCGLIPNPQWTTDEKHIAFTTTSNSQDSVDIIDVTNGTLAKYLTTSTFANGVVVRFWLDNTRIYVTSIPVDQPPDTLYLLDTSKGTGQKLSDLTTIVSHKFFGDFDSSYDGARLFVNYGFCGQGGCIPPGLITVQPATGGTQTTILNSPQYDTTAVRAVTAKTLLVVINNTQIVNTNADQSHNGLWEMNTDGSGLKRLTTDAAHQGSALNNFSQYPWSNVSRDGSMYALQQYGGNSNVSLLYGSLNSGNPTSFASIADGTQLSIVGWTTM